MCITLNSIPVLGLPHIVGLLVQSGLARLGGCDRRDKILSSFEARRVVLMHQLSQIPHLGSVELRLTLCYYGR